MFSLGALPYVSCMYNELGIKILIMLAGIRSWNGISVSIILNSLCRKADMPPTCQPIWTAWVKTIPRQPLRMCGKKQKWCSSPQSIFYCQIHLYSKILTLWLLSQICFYLLEPCIEFQILFWNEKKSKKQFVSYRILIYQVGLTLVHLSTMTSPCTST